MSDSILDYEKMVEEALRGVVRLALQQIIDNGGRVIGDHHFFIAFRTDYPGVKVAPRITAKYPREMTIVIQHQFWDLWLDEKGFSISLTFGGMAEVLYIPFAAVQGFHDPSEEFMLEFEVESPALHIVDNASAPQEETETDGKIAQVIAIDSFRKK